MRFVATSLLALVLSCCASAPPAIQRPTPQGTPTVVLVHGSWHTASSWDLVTKELEAKGIAWAAVELPSTAPEPAFFMPGLPEDIAATKVVLSRIDGPVVLVGHSYGGLVISGAGLDHRVASLVFLCAYIPNPNQSLIGMSLEATGPAPLLSDAVSFDLFAGLTTVDPALAPAALYGDLPPAQARKASQALVPSSMVAARQSVPVVAWAKKPSTAVLCTDDEAIPPSLQKTMSARLTGPVTSISSSHSVLLSSPGHVANIIESAVLALPSTD